MLTPPSQVRGIREFERESMSEFYVDPTRLNGMHDAGRLDPQPIRGGAAGVAFGDDATDVVAELPGLILAPGRTGGLRFLPDPATRGWTVDIPPIHRVPTTAAEVRAFATACRRCLAAAPGEYDVEVFDDGRDEGLLGFEITPGGALNLQLVLNLSGAVSMEGPNYDRTRVERLVAALLDATG
jgi:hypothetical protein